jgi:hypothetical protein
MKKKPTPAKAESATASAPPAAKAAPLRSTKAPKKPEKKPEKKTVNPLPPPPQAKKWMRGDPTSEIVIVAKGKVHVNPRNPAKAAALAVIHQLAKRAQALPTAEKLIVKNFLTAAYADVKKGGGSNGGAAADPFPPPEPGS